MNIKKIKEIKICKKFKKIIIGLMGVIIMLGVIYGLGYAPYQQLKFTKATFENSYKNLISSEAKDITACNEIVAQQLQIVEKQAEKEERDVLDSEKKSFAIKVFNRCLSLVGRDYLSIEETTQNLDKETLEENTLKKEI